MNKQYIIKRTAAVNPLSRTSLLPMALLVAPILDTLANIMDLLYGELNDELE